MARYISLLSFTEQGAAKLKKSTARAAAFANAAKKAGVTVEAQYWLAGAYDGILILNGDSAAKVLNCLAGLVAEGNVRTKTLQAFDAAEFKAITG